jgi:mRNA interferase MazF
VRRGDCYRVANPSPQESKRFRVFVVVGRQVVIDSRLATVVCAPVYSVHDGLASQVPIRIDEGLLHDSSIHCDELISLPKSALTNFIGTLPPAKLQALTQALRVALDIPD